MQEGKCIIFSAPSGAGKTTIVKRLLEEIKALRFSVSACTRERRVNETDGKDYYFLSINDFKNKINRNEFIEWEEVYTDHYYGTLKKEIERIWQEGHHVIFDVDVVGGLNLKKYFGDKALAIFVMPPSIQELEARLRGRATETEDRLAKRIGKAEQELKTADQFDVILVNEHLEEACEEAKSLVRNFID
ncbi:guanylate kinase [Acidiluteibacter ferrifornacis]|uniref:Guanylate kinase n=1 Tax=Acidiluteibacter ferrifornacis TaxID=2692424 RepID=A0A6N9NI38_9FLAO|nr:guanylate kinase [Acidiluteibacter ferrifornacis]NBG64867.1 guanylate kinase [Acidiluteibacter ferrifornacis]